MNHEQFCQKYIGSFVERRAAGVGYRNQCVDLAIAYLVDVWGVPMKELGIGNAVTWADGGHIPDAFGKWVENTPAGVPGQGSIIVFSVSAPGHIAIVDAADGLNVTVIEQNGGGKADSGEKLNAAERASNCVRRYVRNYTSWPVKGWYEQSSASFDFVFPVYFQGRPLRKIPVCQIQFDRTLDEMHTSRFEALEYGYRRGTGFEKLETILTDPRWAGHTKDPILVTRHKLSGTYRIANGYHRVYLARKYHIGYVLAFVTT